MRRQKRRPIYYSASSLYDGTILGIFPTRKPLPKVLKRDKLKIDDDGVCETFDSGMNLADIENEKRFRFQNILAIRLNTRRAIRELASPHLLKLEKDMNDIRNQLNQIQQILLNKAGT
ncbi:MAG: hypothetical protein ACYC54_11380 [Sedimentisphaerales bacterium]